MSGGSSKAYEMMSCYEGLLELYRVTGKPEYLQAVRKVTAGIRDTEITVIGSGSSWERWCRGHSRQIEPLPEWMETCVTATWLKLNAQLLRLTGEPQYADEIEQTAYNALMAAQKPDGAWWCHYNPLEGIRQPAPEQCKMHMNCCVANGPRGLMLLPALALMSSAAGPTVNLYEPARATLPLASGSSVTLDVSGDYPRHGAVEICVRPDRAAEFTLSLRIPAWSRATQVEVAGKPVAGAAAGKYLRLRRLWQAGDRVALRFAMDARVIRDPGGSGRVAVVRGPLVLAIDKRSPGRTRAEAGPCWPPTRRGTSRRSRCRNPCRRRCCWRWTCRCDWTTASRSRCGCATMPRPAGPGMRRRTAGVAAATAGRGRSLRGDLPESSPPLSPVGVCLHARDWAISRAAAAFHPGTSGRPKDAGAIVDPLKCCAGINEIGFLRFSGGPLRGSAGYRCLRSANAL